MGKKRPKSAKRQADFDASELCDEKVSERRTRSASSRDVPPATLPHKKQKQQHKRKVTDGKDLGTSSPESETFEQSAASLIMTARREHQTKQAQKNESVKVTPEAASTSIESVKFHGMSISESESVQQESDACVDGALTKTDRDSDVQSVTPKRHGTTKSVHTPQRDDPRSTPKSHVKAYGMPQVIQGKIVGQTDTSVYLKVNKSITICGAAYVRVVKGTMKIAGYELKPSARKYPVYSPNCYALLTISVVDTEGMNTDGIEKKIESDIVQITEKCAVIEMSQLTCEKCDFVTTIEKNKVIFLSPGYPLPVIGTRVITDNLPTLTEHPEHKQAADVICRLIASGSIPTVMLCGGKNAGKSTFSRYLLNRALSVRGCGEVAYLECDVGQTEFTPSNFVSLSVVSEPLLGPPFTHHTWPHAAVYYGNASPEKDAHGYLRCLRKVYKAYTNLPHNVPLIVNTMGWNKGLGLRLFIDILRMTKATHIIEIDCLESPGRNFPDMTAHFVDSLDGFSTVAGEKCQHEVIHIPSLINIKSEWTGKFIPKDYRNLIFFSYFGLSLLPSVVPYEVPWSAIAVHIDHSSIAPPQLLHALNGAVVALGVLPLHQFPLPSDPVNPNAAPAFITNTKRSVVPFCKGLGIIRSIDPQRKVFHVISPLSLNQLRKVNYFKLGALSIPEQLIRRQSVTEALPRTIPYYGEYRDSLGSTAVARRRHTIRGQKK